MADNGCTLQGRGPAVQSAFLINERERPVDLARHMQRGRRNPGPVPSPSKTTRSIRQACLGKHHARPSEIRGPLPAEGLQPKLAKFRCGALAGQARA
jgi:hypothetical protein